MKRLLLFVLFAVGSISSFANDTTLLTALKSGAKLRFQTDLVVRSRGHQTIQSGRNFPNPVWGGVSFGRPLCKISFIDKDGMIGVTKKITKGAIFSFHTHGNYPSEESRDPSIAIQFLTPDKEIAFLAICGRYADEDGIYGVPTLKEFNAVFGEIASLK